MLLPQSFQSTIQRLFFYDGYYEIKNSINVIAKNDCTYTLCIQINIPNTSDKESAKSLIREEGFNVEDFEIEYEFY